MLAVPLLKYSDICILIRSKLSHLTVVRSPIFSFSLLLGTSIAAGQNMLHHKQLSGSKVSHQFSKRIIMVSRPHVQTKVRMQTVSDASATAHVVLVLVTSGRSRILKWGVQFQFCAAMLKVE